MKIAWGRCLALLALTGVLAGAHARAQAPANGTGALPSSSLAGPALACAVEWKAEAPDPNAVCAALGRELGRPVQRVDDARSVKRGDAVQLLSTDLHWIVIFLRNGQTSAWTRVSKALSEGKELPSLARAARALSQERRSQGNACVRLEPGAQGAQNSDLVYPWAELKRCKRKVYEVPDPWSAG